jgi:putative transcriptional regulator
MEMNEQDFSLMLESVKEAGAIMRGEKKPGRSFELAALDIKSIREQTHKTQNDFAMMIGVSPGTLRNWEQDRRNPTVPRGLYSKLSLVIQTMWHRY